RARGPHPAERRPRRPARAAGRQDPRDRHEPRLSGPRRVHGSLRLRAAAPGRGRGGGGGVRHAQRGAANAAATVLLGGLALAAPALSFVVSGARPEARAADLRADSLKALRVGDTATAVALIGEAVALVPESGRLRRDLGRTLLLAGDRA